MGSLFGKPEKSKSTDKSKPVPVTRPGNEVNDKDKAILDLKNARDRLKKYKKKVCFTTISCIR